MKEWESVEEWESEEKWQALERKNRMIAISPRIFSDNNISDGAKILYYHLWDCYYTEVLKQDSRLVYPDVVTNEYLCKLVNKSTATVKKYLNELEAGKYISISCNGKKNDRTIAVKGSANFMGYGGCFSVDGGE